MPNRTRSGEPASVRCATSGERDGLTRRHERQQQAVAERFDLATAVGLEVLPHEVERHRDRRATGVVAHLLEQFRRPLDVNEHERREPVIGVRFAHGRRVGGGPEPAIRHLPDLARQRVPVVREMASP